MIHDAAAVVTVAATTGCVQTNHHLVPPTMIAQALGQACHTALGQLLELLHHLLSLVHGVEALDPKHDFYLHLQGQHIAKRFVLGIDQPSAVHVRNVTTEAIDHSTLRTLINPPVSTNHRLALAPLGQG